MYYTKLYLENTNNNENKPWLYDPNWKPTDTGNNNAEDKPHITDPNWEKPEGEGEEDEGRFNFLDPIVKYYQGLIDAGKKAEEEAKKRAEYVADILSDPATMKDKLVADLAPGLSTISAAVLGAVQGEKRSGPISDFMKSTDRGLASIRIPTSKSASQRPINKLQKRENTKGFYK